MTNVDLAISRQVTIGESRQLIFTAEALNSANHANFGIPVRYLEAPGFGAAVSTITPPRPLQFSMKLSF
jgi:hypothetical protein